MRRLNVSGNDISYITKRGQSAQYIHLCDGNHANTLHRSYYGLRKGKGNITLAFVPYYIAFILFQTLNET